MRVLLDHIVVLASIISACRAASGGAQLEGTARCAKPSAHTRGKPCGMRARVCFAAIASSGGMDRVCREKVQWPVYVLAWMVHLGTPMARASRVAVSQGSVCLLVPRCRPRSYRSAACGLLVPRSAHGTRSYSRGDPNSRVLMHRALRRRSHKCRKSGAHSGCAGSRKFDVGLLLALLLVHKLQYKVDSICTDPI
jgi:hypothetical protein